MRLSVELTNPQAEQLFWWIRDQLRDETASPRQRALKAVHDELENRLADA